MLKIGKTVTTALVLATLASPTFASTQTEMPVDGVFSCGVPVCNMDKTLEELKTLNENERYNYVLQLIKTYADSNDVKVLENLLAISRELKDLFIELGDSDWVVREATTLGGHAIFGLAKYSEIDALKLGGLYKMIEIPAKRYEIIAYYHAMVESIEDLSVLSEVIEFGKIANSHSIAINDEAWIIRAADTLAAEATIRLVSLEPSHEGVFEIEATRPDGMLPIDKIVILDSSSERNLVVNFISSKYNQVVLSYARSTIVGNKIEGKVMGSDGMSSRFEITLDRVAGKVSGVIQTTRIGSIHFEGERSFTVKDLYTGSSPWELGDIDAIGTMQGEIMGVKGTLAIQSFEKNVYSASFVADDRELSIDYQGKFYPKSGILALTHKNKVKLVLALRKDGDIAEWKGVTFSITNGNVRSASFAPIRLVEQ